MTNSIKRTPGVKQDLTGHVYGKLTVLCESANRLRGRVTWTCKCECGNTKDIAGADLRRQKQGTVSCGCVSANQLDDGEAVLNNIVHSYRLSAKKRGYNFNLTKEEVRTITKSNCVYCGCEPANERKSKYGAGSYIHNGIDRVDNTKGYTVDNVVACCTTCNRIKSDHDLEDLKAHMRRMLAHMEG